jgi:hypothetical protein
MKSSALPPFGRIRALAQTCLIAALLPATLIPLRAQTPPEDDAAYVAPATLSAVELDDLLGPIALYPDALVSLILPASTVPADITLAARYLERNGDSASVDTQPWDESVRSLARNPDVLKWLDANLEWTAAVGDAFVAQPADVMNSIQRLRRIAMDNGNLVNTSQQTVVLEQEDDAADEVIRIVPANPDVIYVPQYDPQIVYMQSCAPVVSFGSGCVAGAWLSYDCDWGHAALYHGSGCGWNNRARWLDRGRVNGNVNVTRTTNITNVTNITNNNTRVVVNRWRPSPASQRMVAHRQAGNPVRAAQGNAIPASAPRQETREIRRETQAPRPVALPGNAVRAQENAARARAQGAPSPRKQPAPRSSGPVPSGVAEGGRQRNDAARAAQVRQEREAQARRAQQRQQQAQRPPPAPDHPRPQPQVRTQQQQQAQNAQAHPKKKDRD